MGEFIKGTFREVRTGFRKPKGQHKFPGLVTVVGMGVENMHHPELEEPKGRRSNARTREGSCMERAA